eukprot:878995-Pelagomonas_calceolata.AAC.3
MLKKLYKYIKELGLSHQGRREEKKKRLGQPPEAVCSKERRDITSKLARVSPKDPQTYTRHS